MGAPWSAILDFGATPTDEASVTVTGLTGIQTNSRVEAWFMRATTADHNANSHDMASHFVTLSPGDNVADTSTLIKATVWGALVTGQFQIEGAWF
jgi:hypothetical protein